MRAVTIRTILALCVGSVLAVLTAACDSVSETEATATPSIATETPTVTATASPAFEPTSTPTTTPTLTPVAKSSWQCYEGGLGCYDTFQAVRMLNTNEGWIANSQGILFHYNIAPGNVSPTWQRVESPSSSTFYSLSVINSNEWYGIQGGGLVHYQNGVWQHLPSRTGHLLDLAMLNPDEGWAVGDQGVIVNYAQGDLQPISSPTNDRLNAIVMLNPDEGWAVGLYGTILHYHDQIWEQVPISMMEDLALRPDLNDIVMINDKEGWAAGYSLLHYQNGVWQEVPNPLTDSQGILELSMVDAEEGWAVGWNGIILQYTEGQWQFVESPTKNTLYSIDMINAQEGWAVGQNGTILHYLNEVWKLVNEAQ